jgi:phosphoribosylanthranilate isomerase
MEPTANPRVKICCIKNLDEARLAIRNGASALGFVGPMPSGPGVLDEKTIVGIIRHIPPPIATFFLTSEQSAGGIAAQHRRVHSSTIQIVDSVTSDCLRELRRLLAGVKIVQVIHVRDEKSVDEALAFAGEVDALLLDSGRPDLTVKELGGTGRTHNWEISRRIRKSVEVPVFLAGGLNARNVRDAIDKVGPFGVDVCTGVRTNGALDPIKLAAFFEGVSDRRKNGESSSE